MRIALAFVRVSACAPSSAQLVVDLCTDLVPPAELFAIDATLRAHDGSHVVARLTPAFATDDLDRSAERSRPDPLGVRVGTSRHQRKHQPTKWVAEQVTPPAPRGSSRWTSPDRGRRRIA